MTAYSPIQMPADAFPRAATPRNDATRDALLKAADRLLVAEGPGSLTVRAIATEAEMSTMNVYSRFGSKEGIIDELFRRGFAALHASMAEVPETADPLDDLRQLGIVYRNFAKDHSAYYSLMFDRPVRGFEPSVEALDMTSVGLEHLAHRVQRCIDANQLIGDNAAEMAASIWAAVHGLVCIERFQEAYPIENWDGLFERTMQMIARGLSVAPVAS